MRKISYRPIYNRKNQLNTQGKALLQIEAYLERRKVYFSTHIYLTPEQWDNKKKLIKLHPNAEALNYKVREFISALEKKELSIWRDGRTITLQSLKDEFQSKTSKSFLSFIKEDIEASQSKESTKRNRMTTYWLLSKFRSHIEFKELSPRLVYDFEKFLFDNHFKTNTVAKHMKHFKAFVNSAINKAYIDLSDYPFRRYHIKMSETRHTFLIPEELEKLENLELSGRHYSLAHTLDAFLFCCYTGLRYSDFVNLSEKNIVTIDKRPWLVFNTVKTGAEVKLPLTFLFEGKAYKLLRKYKGHLSDFFSIKPNSTVNKELIRIRKIAKLEKHFSFHSARHTNATLLIYKGANITTVQKLLGHRNITTTQIYSEVMSSTILKDLKKCAKG
ncbi:MAG: site-specific integrase [Bacteroides sp.]|nr:site-specific integrase [Bacteroides sp.]